MDYEEFQKQIDSCDIPIEDILQEHLRTPYRHKVSPFEGVPVLEGDEAERFDQICEMNSTRASSKYNEEKEEWVKAILKKKTQ